MTDSTYRGPGGLTASRYLQQLASLLAERGIDERRLLREAGMRESELAPDQWVRADQLQRFVVSAERLSGAHDLGLLLGKQLNLSAHGVTGIAGLTAPNARAAIALASRYFPLITGLLSLTAREESRHLLIIVTTLDSLAPESERFLVQTVISSIDVMGGFMLGAQTPTFKVELTMTEDAGMRDSLSDAVTDLRFGQSHNAIHVPGDLLDVPFPLADAHAHQQALAQCDQALLQLQRQQRFADRLLNALLESSGAMPGIEEIARTLHVSSRTIHRRLRREGTHFRALQNAARMQRARHLLLHEGRAITETAHLLGYRDSANFTRAFRRETGMSPSEFLSFQRNLNGQAER